MAGELICNFNYDIESRPRYITYIFRFESVSSYKPYLERF